MQTKRERIKPKAVGFIDGTWRSKTLRPHRPEPNQACMCGSLAGSKKRGYDITKPEEHQRREGAPSCATKEKEKESG